MAAPAITLAGLRKLDPCHIPDGLPERGKITAAEARKCGVTFDGVVWVAKRMALNDPDIERRLRLWIADCSAHVLHVYEQDEASDMLTRNAIVASRKFARDLIAADEKGRVAWGAAAAAAIAAERAAAWAVARDSVRASSWVAVWDAAWAAEEAWQFDRLIAWLGDAEPDDWPLP